jgi:hypothetical protein
MYAQARHAQEHHRDILAQAREHHRAMRVIALRKAARRVARAERRLVDAQSNVLKVRAALDGS